MPSPIASERFRSHALSREVTLLICAHFGNRFGMRHQSSQPRLSNQVPLVPSPETRPCVRERLNERSSSLFALLLQKRPSTGLVFTNPIQENVASPSWICTTPVLLLSAPALRAPPRTHRSAVVCASPYAYQTWRDRHCRSDSQNRGSHSG